MGSQGGCGDLIGEITQTETLGMNSNPLGSHGSLYNLTLDEVQNQLLSEMGKPLGSMNLDELFKSVFTGDVADNNPVNDQLFTSTDLGKKTVDELWRDIQRGEKRSGGVGRKTVLGEMTLEDFLVKAGVVAESKILGSVHVRVDPFNHPMPLMNYQQQQQQNMVPVSGQGHCLVQQPIVNLLHGNPLMDGALSDAGWKGAAMDNEAEKSVERRQKRMIKNRESAARSRARKQAYTHELENKVSRLEEENSRLKRRKELETMLPVVPLVEPRYQLRRTNSAPM